MSTATRPDSEIRVLLADYASSDPRLDIWKRYPDISETDDAYTDRWACENVSAEFVAFARSRGWDAVSVHGVDSYQPLAMDHCWVRLSTAEGFLDVDWTARQYHNLFNQDGLDPDVLSLPWPLTWDPVTVGPKAHLVVGEFTAVSPEEH